MTFTVEVANTSVEPVTLASLVDDLFGDLLDGANPAVSSNTCDDQATGIGVGGTFTCSFDAALAGSPAGPAHTNTVTAAAGDGEGNVVFASDGETVSFTDVLPPLTVSKTPSAGSAPESGGTITRCGTSPRAPGVQTNRAGIRPPPGPRPPRSSCRLTSRASWLVCADPSSGPTFPSTRHQRPSYLDRMRPLRSSLTPRR